MAQQFWNKIQAKHPQANVLIVSHLHVFLMLNRYLYDQKLEVFWKQADF